MSINSQVMYVCTQVAGVYQFAFIHPFIYQKPVFLEYGNSLTRQCLASFRGEGDTHTHTDTLLEHNQNRRSGVKPGQLTLSSLFRPSLPSSSLRQSVLSNNTTPLSHTHTLNSDIQCSLQPQHIKLYLLSISRNSLNG